MDYTKDEIAEIKAAKVEESDESFYLHCAHCLQEGIPDGVSAAEYMNYVAASCPIKLSTGKKITVAAVFCKRCGRLVWDSRHLTPIKE